MAEPVLVIHGVATRDKAAFEKIVADLGKRVGAAWNFFPVYWGDLGANTQNVADTLFALNAPTASGLREIAMRGPDGMDATDPALIAAALGAVGASLAAGQRAAPKAKAAPSAAIVADAAALQATQSSSHADAVRAAVRAQIPGTRFIKEIHDEETLRAIGEMVGESVRDTPATTLPGTTRGFGDLLHNAVGGALGSVDNLVGKLVGKALGNVFQNLRSGLGAAIGSFLGDIFVYHDNKARIQQRVQDVIAQNAPGCGTHAKPLHAIAHSLGGLICFDMAVSPQSPLFLKSFTTFGNQASFFDVLDPRPGLPPYAHGGHVQLPDTIAKWVNLWDPLDVLAFSAANVFRLSDGSAPRDVRLNPLPEGVIAQQHFMTHSVYWQTEDLVKSLKETLA